MIRRAMATLVPRFNTWRMVQEYVYKYYKTGAGTGEVTSD